LTQKIKNNGNEVTTDPRPVTQYAFDADTHYITYGLGYQFIPEEGVNLIGRMVIFTQMLPL
jgi:hypothetical protein